MSVCLYVCADREGWGKRAIDCKVGTSWELEAKTARRATATRSATQNAETEDFGPAILTAVKLLSLQYRRIYALRQGRDIVVKLKKISKESSRKIIHGLHRFWPEHVMIMAYSLLSASISSANFFTVSTRS